MIDGDDAGSDHWCHDHKGYIAIVSVSYVVSQRHSKPDSLCDKTRAHH